MITASLAISAGSCASWNANRPEITPNGTARAQYAAKALAVKIQSAALGPRSTPLSIHPLSNGLGVNVRGRVNRNVAVLI